MEQATLTEKLDKLITDVAVMKAQQELILPPLSKMLEDHESRLRSQEKVTENLKTKVAIAGSVSGGFMGVLIAFIYSKLHL